MPNTIFIAFANQKGGTGKSTTSRIAATNMWYTNPEIKICLWDADNPQFSNFKLREKDIIAYDQLPDNIKVVKRAKTKFTEHNAKYPLYPIRKISTSNMEEMYDKDTEEFDIIFVDLPGVIHSDEMARLLPVIDILMVPTQVDAVSMESTVEFIEVLKQIAEERDFPFKDSIYFFFNRTEVKKLPGIENRKAEYLEMYPWMKFMESTVHLRKNIEDVEMSTMFPLIEDSKNNNDHFRDFYNEFFKLIN